MTILIAIIITEGEQNWDVLYKCTNKVKLNQFNGLHL